MAVLGSKQIKELVGHVVSDKMNKTIVVSVSVVKMHPLYKKRYMKHKKYYAHIEDMDACVVGDRVKIRQSRPISKLKRRIFVSKA